MSDMDLTGYETTTAADLVRVIDGALGDWDRTTTGPGLWVWQYATDDLTQVVAVNALPDRILTPTGMWPEQVGPTVLGGVEGELFASATLPHVSDRSDLMEALRVVAVLVPDLEPATWSAGERVAT